MKSGTVVRVVYAIVAVAILVIAALPMASALPEMKDEGLRTGTHSVYDLSLMDGATLSENISDAIGAGEGFTIEYGSSTESVDSDNLSDVVGRVMSSGAAVAVLKDSDGNTVTQDSIEYRNAVLFGQRSGLLVQGALFGSLKIDVSVRMFSGDGVLDHVTEPVGDDLDGEISVGYVIPTVLYNVFGAYGCHLGSVISADYDRLFELEVRNGVDDLHFDHSLTREGTSTVLEVRGCSGSGTGTGSVGGVGLEFSYDGSAVMRLSCEGKLQDALLAGMSDGRLSIDYGGTTYLMTESETESLIAVIGAMEAGA